MKIKFALVCAAALTCGVASSVWAAAGQPQSGFIPFKIGHKMLGSDPIPTQCQAGSKFVCIAISNQTNVWTGTGTQPAAFANGVGLTVGMSGGTCTSDTWAIPANSGGYLWTSSACMATAVTVASQASSPAAISMPMGTPGPMKLDTFVVNVGGSNAAPAFTWVPSTLSF